MPRRTKKEDWTIVHQPPQIESHIWSALYECNNGTCWHMTWGDYDGKPIPKDTALALARKYLKDTKKVYLLQCVCPGSAYDNRW